MKYGGRVNGFFGPLIILRNDEKLRKGFGMKKLIALVIVMALIGGGSAFAVDWMFLVPGLVCLAGGGVCVALPALGVMSEPEDKVIFYAMGGGLILASIPFILIGLLSDDPYYANAQDDNPLRHVSLGVAPNGSVTVGYRKNF